MDLHNYASFTPSESEFLAENELVTIVPNTKIDKINFIMGTYGPFMAHTPGTAPLWLACMLKESQQARIVCPPWMEKGALEESVKAERGIEFFSRLPYHFVEIAELLLRYARDDITAADRVETLLAEVQALREGKVQAVGRKVLATSGGNSTAVQENVNVSDAGAMESNMLREGIIKAMDLIAELNRAQKLRAHRRTRATSAFAAGLASTRGMRRAGADDEYDAYGEDGGANQTRGGGEDDEGTEYTGAGGGGGAALRDAMRRRSRKTLKARNSGGGNIRGARVDDGQQQQQETGGGGEENGGENDMGNNNISGTATTTTTAGEEEVGEETSRSGARVDIAESDQQQTENAEGEAQEGGESALRRFRR